MSRVTVKPKLFDWASERSGLPIDVLLSKFPKFESWVSEKTKPTLKQLEKFARTTYTPLGYFFLDEPPEEKLPIPDFRTLDDEPVRRPSPHLIETMHTMQHRQDWMRDNLVEQGAEPLPFIGSVSQKSPALKVAESIRSTLGIAKICADRETTPQNALLRLRNAAEGVGILTMLNGVVGNNTHRKLDAKEFQGFVLCDDIAPLIFVNNADYKAAQIFTLAHELAHLWLGKAGLFNLDKTLPLDHEVERFCNQVAAEVLVPEEDLRKFWPIAVEDREPHKAVARRFKVSQIVAARRALDLELIDKPSFFSFYDRREEEFEAAKSSKKGGGNFYNNQPGKISTLFGSAVVRAAREGRLLYRDAYRLTGLHGKTFDNFFGRQP